MKEGARHILDRSAGGSLHPAAAAALQACGTAGWSDPRSVTTEGRRASDLLSAARSSLASSLGGVPDTLHQAAGGGHAVADGLVGLLEGMWAAGQAPPALVVSSVDHSAALRVARWWRSLGHPVHTVNVDSVGRFDAAEMVELALGSGPSVVCLQLANGEVGTRQPVEEVLAQLAGTESSTLLDATACVGRIPIPSGWSALAADATSWCGPRGVGMLLTSPSTPWRVREPALEPELAVAPMVAAAAALEQVLASREADSAHTFGLVARLRRELPALVDDLDVPGDPDSRLPHVLTVSALYADGESIVRHLDGLGLAVGSGSACANDSGEPSHVLAAMGALTGGNVRLALPVAAADPTLDEAVDTFLLAFPDAVRSVRTMMGAP